jgi:hypothetical protein
LVWLIKFYHFLPFSLSRFFSHALLLYRLYLCSLEHLVTSLKSPLQTNNTNYHPTNNLANNANKNSLPSDFLQPQQHQLQIQINGGDSKNRRSAEQHVSTPVGSQTTGKLLSPKSAKASQVILSSAGPVTDL